MDYTVPVFQILVGLPGLGRGRRIKKSMTTLWSKILESLVARFTLDETSHNWKPDQFGGRKGSSTDHVLVSLWDRILNGLERGAKSVVLAAIDFSKTFS